MGKRTNPKFVGAFTDDLADMTMIEGDFLTI